jgi:hypothetical protein
MANNPFTVHFLFAVGSIKNARQRSSNKAHGKECVAHGKERFSRSVGARIDLLNKDPQR